MHMFKKLALAAAIASTPMMATSLELLDDDMLSGVTGQDGISINLDANISVDLAIEDTSGARLADGNATDNGGFIVMEGLHVQSTDIQIDIDSGSSGDGANKGVLVIGVDLKGLKVNGGLDTNDDPIAFNLGVAGSDLAQGSSSNANVVPAGARDSSTGFDRAQDAVDNYTTIVSVGELDIGNVKAGIELGPEASQFMTVQTDAFDLNIDGLTITDPTSAQDPAEMGTLGIQHIAIKNVEVDATVSITEDGLVVESSDSTMDIALMGVGFGTKQGFADAGGIVLDPADPAAGGDSKWGTIGNVYLLNLNMEGTKATISGR